MSVSWQAAAPLILEGEAAVSSATAEPASSEGVSYEPAAEGDRLLSIGQAAAELGLKAHVLRSWETRFEALSPVKRADGRRLYGPADMELLRQLQNLLHVQNMPVREVLRIISGQAGELKAAGGVAERTGSEAERAGDDTLTISRTGASVRDLQSAVREALARGDFRGNDESQPSPARQRLETLLVELTDLKSRIDTVRGAA